MHKNEVRGKINGLIGCRTACRCALVVVLLCAVSCATFKWRPETYHKLSVPAQYYVASYFSADDPDARAKASTARQEWVEIQLNALRDKYGAVEDLDLDGAEGYFSALSQPLSMSSEQLRRELQRQNWPSEDISKVLAYVSIRDSSLNIDGSDVSEDWSYEKRAVAGKLTTLESQLQRIVSFYENEYIRIQSQATKLNGELDKTLKQWEEFHATQSAWRSMVSDLKKIEGAYQQLLEKVRLETEGVDTLLIGAESYLRKRNVSLDIVEQVKALEVKLVCGMLTAEVEQKLAGCDFALDEIFKRSIAVKKTDKVAKVVLPAVDEAGGLIKRYIQRYNIPLDTKQLTVLWIRCGSVRGKCWAQQIWASAYEEQYWDAYQTVSSYRKTLGNYTDEEKKLLYDALSSEYSAMLPGALQYYNAKAADCRADSFFGIALTFQRMNDELVCYLRDAFNRQPAGSLKSEWDRSEMRRELDRARVTEQITQHIVINEFDGQGGAQFSAELLDALRGGKEESKFGVVYHTESSRPAAGVDVLEFTGQIHEMAVEEKPSKELHLIVDIIPWYIETNALSMNGKSLLTQVNRLLRHKRVEEYGKVGKLHLTYRFNGKEHSIKSDFESLPNIVMSAVKTNESYSYCMPRYNVSYSDYELSRNPRYVQQGAGGAAIAYDFEIRDAMRNVAIRYIEEQIAPMLRDAPVQVFYKNARNTEDVYLKANDYSRCYEYVFCKVYGDGEMMKIRDWFAMEKKIENYVHNTWDRLDGLWQKCVTSALKTIEQ